MIKRISVTLIEEDVDAALIAYVAHKYGMLRNAHVEMKVKIIPPERSVVTAYLRVKFVEAEVSGDVS